IQTGATVRDANRMRMSDEGYYLKSYEEMAALFDELPEALRNTLWIAERCQVNLDSNGYHLPRFEVPAEYPDAQSYLRALVEEGIRRLYPEITPQIQARVDYELDVIHQMGFDTYFLIVWDLCRASKERDIWWNVRGSGAASIVAYALGITKLDPLRHGLVFERFLNPGRITMPDIDLDFPDDRRAEMIQYTIEKYGRDHVAQIITFGTLGARAAIRDVGRAMDIDLSVVNQIAKLVPEGPKVHIDKALQESEELRQRYESDPKIRELLDAARSVEGLARHASTHAAGVIISDKPLVHYTPLHRPTSDSSDTQCPTTQFPMEILESIGLLKVDFLGLATLTLMRRACELIEQNHGIQLDLDTIPVADEKAFELLSSGEVTGVFQVESAGMRRVLTNMRPTKFEHIVATVALYRPGPMEYIDTYIRRMHGEEEVTYKHPLLEPILGETYGIIVYQEQIIRILTDLAGYTASEADLLRRAVGKKKEDVLVKHRELFIEGCKRHGGIDADVADAIYSDILYFARYGFNKAHAADYAVITCQTAYLKAHYPVEYMTALLTVERHNTEKVGMLVGECRRMGISILPPDINKSQADFTIESNAIRFGLSAIKNVGEGAVELILRERETGGPFKDLADFCRRVDLRQLNKRVLECLIKAGALDCFGPRHQLLAALDRIMAESSAYHQARQIGQMSMFDLVPAFGESLNGSLMCPLEDAPPIERRQLLAWEKELVGVYLSEHPLQKLAQELSQLHITGSSELSEELAGQTIWVAGIVTEVRRIVARSQKPMAFVRMEDLQGAFELVVFPRLFQETESLWAEDRLLLAKAKVKVQEGRLSLVCEAVRENFTKVQLAGEIEEAEAGRGGPAVDLPAGKPAKPPAPRRPRVLHIRFQRSGDYERDVGRLNQIYQLLQSFEGDDRCVIHVQDGQQCIVLEFPNVGTRYCPQLEQKLRGIGSVDSTWVDSYIIYAGEHNDRGAYHLS
ncbi:MAG: DNA polymerase III subunit alpha, partial [Anaerolineae bacterium]